MNCNNWQVRRATPPLPTPASTLPASLHKGHWAIFFIAQNLCFCPASATSDLLFLNPCYTAMFCHRGTEACTSAKLTQIYTGVDGSLTSSVNTSVLGIKPRDIFDRGNSLSLSLFLKIVLSLLFVILYPPSPLSFIFYFLSVVS